MRLVVFGSNGQTGRLLVDQALAAGHEVTAVARRPESIEARHDRLRCVAGDLLDAESTAAVIRDHDAVLSTAGPRTRSPTRMYSNGAAHIARGMAEAGIRRVVCVSSIGVDPTADIPFPVSLVMSMILRPLLREVYEDGARMEAALAATDLDWTVLRAPMLTNGPRTERYRTAIGRHVKGAVRVSRADVADCVLRLLIEPASFGAWAEVAN